MLGGNQVYDTFISSYNPIYLGVVEAIPLVRNSLGSVNYEEELTVCFVKEVACAAEESALSYQLSRRLGNANAAFPGLPLQTFPRHNSSRQTPIAGEDSTVNVKDSPKLVSDLNRLAVDIDETQRSLVNSAMHFHRLGKHIEFLRGIIKYLGGEIAKENKTTRLVSSSSWDNSAPKKEVCPEKFMGENHRYGRPFYRKGFDQVNCTDFVPINQLVTILVILPEERSTEGQQQQVLQGIVKYYPNIPIALALKENISEEVVKKLKLNLKNIVSSDLMHGETWSKLLQEVTTPYVLFARM
ncbi:hypothetical protein OS493_007141 [Desmophyllum pertusum]|uniref:Uncharacterized protein n=1 Tax=Desmophyllum pertusum TaxID=174260 RepID=A0A9W9ZFG1_9CNID|nr:hypothetical protein OS493_007141 [Desmophyllum pertusum]